jgi:ATP-dependent Lon protease
MRISRARVEKLLGVPKFRWGRGEDESQIGLATGLAWTQVGGDLLLIRGGRAARQGQAHLTGKLGDVMQESAQAAMTYVRSRADALGLDRDFYAKADVHIHVPEGAIPKDGPSAGITMAVALTSALMRVPVRSEVAMTGEITLRGRVLPIGGLKEKVLAAHRAGSRWPLARAGSSASRRASSSRSAVRRARFTTACRSNTTPRSPRRAGSCPRASDSTTNL